MGIIALNSNYIIKFFQNIINFNEDVMVSVLTSSAIDSGFKPGLVKPESMKLVFITSPLRLQH